jgi:hypothetical protein
MVVKRVNVDGADAAVRKFLKSIALGADGVELELNGKVIGKLLPPFAFSEADKKALVEQRWKLIRQAQIRNRGVPSRIIEREIREAVDQVRRGK